MNHEWTEPKPEELAAYADGELSPADHARVESWLISHPDASREVDSWQRIQQVWQKTAPSEPSPAAWAKVRDGVAADLTTRRRFGNSWWGPAGLSAAAALIGVLLLRPLWQQRTVEVEAAFPIATAADVNILSMDPADADALVVGHPPVLGPIELAHVDDVVLVSADSHPEGTPDLWVGAGGSPVIWPGNTDK